MSDPQPDQTPRASPTGKGLNQDDSSSSLTQDDRDAIKLHQDRLEAKKKGELASVPFDGKRPKTTAPAIPRFRLSEDIDLSKADPNCKNCNGNGVKHWQIIEGDADNIPVICKCVARNGGVKRDQLDRILAGEMPSADQIAAMKRKKLEP